MASPRMDVLSIYHWMLLSKHAKIQKEGNKELNCDFYLAYPAGNNRSRAWRAYHWASSCSSTPSSSWMADHPPFSSGCSFSPYRSPDYWRLQEHYAARHLKQVRNLRERRKGETHDSASLLRSGNLMLLPRVLPRMGSRLHRGSHCSALKPTIAFFSSL